jgi:hypothetical protein
VPLRLYAALAMGEPRSFSYSRTCSISDTAQHALSLTCGKLHSAAQPTPWQMHAASRPYGYRSTDW